MGWPLHCPESKNPRIFDRGNLFSLRVVEWGGNGVKNLMELSNPSLSSQLCLSRHSFSRRAEQSRLVRVDKIFLIIKDINLYNIFFYL